MSWRLRAGKPPEGWGEDPKKIEALIKDDAEALSMWENELNPGKGGDNGNRYTKKPSNNNNVMIARKAIQGNSKAHSLSVLKRKAPELFQAAKKTGVQNDPQFYEECWGTK
jgi:hypothetical protein